MGQPFTSISSASVLIASCLILAVGGCGGDPRSALERERDALTVENAALEARLSMSKQSGSYLVADLGENRLRLELQGVILTSQGIRHVRMNDRARDLLSGRDRVDFLASPFRLESEEWFEPPRTQALRDSARTRPDTTGALMEAIRTSPVAARLDYDRGLTLILEGRRSDSFPARIWARIRGSIWSWADGSGAKPDSAGAGAEIHLELSPADIRSLSPNLEPGSRFVLVP